MSDKTEDQIAREKDAVQKMVGAKSAMEAALARIGTLENAIKRMATVLDDMARGSGDGIGYMTYHNEKGSGEAFVSFRKQALSVAEVGRKVL